MANVNTSVKSPGQQWTAAEINNRTEWANSPWKTLGAFSPAMTFDSQGGYDKYTLTGDIELTATGIVNGQVRKVWIEADGVSSITLGTGMSVGITNLTNIIAAGTYLFMFASFDDETGVPSVVLSAPDIEFVEAPPSAEAQAVLDRMSALGPAERAAIIAYVDAEVSDGNWAEIDEFFCFGLNTTDWLTGFVGKTASNTNATRVTNEGASFNGTDAVINTNFVPSTDGVQYLLDEAFSAVFVKDTRSVINATVFAVQGNNDDWLRMSRITTNTTWTVNKDTPVETSSGTIIADEKFYAVKRTASNAQDLYEDGVSQDPQTTVSSDIPDLAVYLGAWNLKGVSGSWWDGTVSTWTIGGNVNPATHNTNVRQLLTDLAII